MLNKIFEFLGKQTIKFSKKIPAIRRDDTHLIIFFFFFLLISILVFTYNTSIKKKRLEEIDQFISNNQTVMLKNFLLNQLKSPYLEYDYIVKNNDTVESILKNKR